MRGMQRDAILTLIENTNANTLLTITKHVRAVSNGGKASVGDSPGTQLANLSRIPASPFSVAVLLDPVVGVKVVYTNLATLL